MAKHFRLYLLLTVLAVFVFTSSVAIWAFYQAVKTENHVRYVGMMNIASEKIAKTIRGMEMNAMNEFDEVEKHLDSPESVIAALESKTSLNPDVRGYFAAFEPNYFEQEGTWFEPYVVHVDTSDFEVRMVGTLTMSMSRYMFPKSTLSSISPYRTLVLACLRMPMSSSTSRLPRLTCSPKASASACL